MYQKISQILEQYPLTVNRSYKGRGALILETENGLRILKEYGGSEKRISFIGEVQAEIQKKVDFRVDTVLQNAEGICISKDMYENQYYMREWFNGRECDTKEREEVVRAAETLAQLHGALEEYEGELPDFITTGQEDIFEEFEKHNRELRKVKNYIREKKQKNLFETEFLKAYESCKPQIQELAEKAAELEPQKKLLCHGDYTQHNVIFLQNGLGICNFEQLCWNTRMSDLTTFLRKIMEKNNWNLGLGMEILSAYEKNVSISTAEWQELYLRMAYPTKFWKIANHYMNAHKAWPCQRDCEKIEHFMNQYEPREQFLVFLRQTW
ncbi:MAG: CotS family spore coat protein [Lachnospiraceae bacterium]